jgi:hypothetical protein
MLPKENPSFDGAAEIMQFSFWIWQQCDKISVSILVKSGHVSVNISCLSSTESWASLKVLGKQYQDWMHLYEDLAGLHILGFSSL